VRVNGEPVRARIRWNAPRSGGDALVDERGGFLVEVEPGAVAFYVDVAERGLELTELLTLVAGASRHDFALEAAQSSVGGFVRRSDGTPVADQEVLAFCPGYDGPGGRARTDDNGAFRVWTTATRGEDLTLRTRTGPLTVSRFPVPAGSEGVELVLPDTGHVELRVLAPAGALEPTELEVAWSDVSSSANELPRRALVPLGDGRWLVEVPAGRIDLEVRAPRSTWAAVRIAGVRIEPHAQPAIELVAFAAPFAANER
jgi:hypothetical protein